MALLEVAARMAGGLCSEGINHRKITSDEGGLGTHAVGRRSLSGRTPDDQLRADPTGPRGALHRRLTDGPLQGQELRRYRRLPGLGSDRRLVVGPDGTRRDGRSGLRLGGRTSFYSLAGLGNMAGPTVCPPHMRHTFLNKTNILIRMRMSGCQFGRVKNSSEMPRRGENSHKKAQKGTKRNTKIRRFCS